ncbi:histidine kinase [Lewinella cohaerens]|uniref:histidine kinase n=1 Tax=Lewinella cohaerens TaxID=70995 RepID=UPI00037CE616|nr:histidine kinase [Lewinella cohaerens]
MKKLYYYIFPILLVVILSSCQEREDNPIYAWEEVMLGDSTEWKELSYDDSHWDGHYKDPTGKGIFWSRMRVKLPPQEKSRKGCGIQVFATAAYEAYWDGVYLGTNGRLAEDGFFEIPGDYQWFSLLPDSLVGDGEHVLALRSTKEIEEPGQHSYVFFDDYFRLTRGPLQVSKYMFMLAGCFLLTAIYFLFFFATEPKEFATLIFSVICFVFMGIIIMEYLKLFHIYPYPFQRTRLEIIDALHFSLGILIPLFFMIHFNFPWKVVGLAIIIAVIGWLEFKYYSNFDWIARKHSTLAWVWSVLLVGYAIYEKKKGAIWVMTGLVLCFIVVNLMPVIPYYYMSSYDVSIFIAFVIIVLTMLYVMSLKRKDERLAYEASLVRSERLKNELLKKNIKPHFIMNTLTSLIDWVEESPKEGAAFIHALADEFELLNEIADYQQIPIGQEIRLCKNHLKVMGYRKEINYLWEQEGIDPNDIIPPAIIHTAVENGVTHGLPNGEGNITFRLVYEITKAYRQYTLTTVAQQRAASKFAKNSTAGHGTGLRYIRARLQESYQDRWELINQPAEEGWQMIIRIKTL